MPAPELETLSHETRGSVAVFEVNDWEQHFNEEIDQGEALYDEAVGDPEITGTVVAFEEIQSLGSEMQSHLSDAWSGLASAAPVDRIAYVADGITAMAVQANVDGGESAVESFEDLDAAVEWAQGDD